MAKALAWLRPYAAGERTHEEFVHSTVSFDRTRREAGLKGFGGLFEPPVARMLFAMAARIEPIYAPLAQRLRTAVWQDAWLDVLWPV